MLFSVCIVWTLLVQFTQCNVEPGEQVWRVKMYKGGDISGLEAILVEPFVKPEREKRFENFTEVYFRVEKKHMSQVRMSLNSHGFTHEVIINDVLQQLEIEDNLNGIKRRRRSISSLDNFDYSSYHNLDDIKKWMKWVARRYSFVRRIKLGESYEGESLYALKVTSNRVRSSRPALYMDAATHAREWISPAALMYVCNQILTNSSYAAMLSAIDYYFVPVVNVDGYAHSWSTERLWRKTRKPFSDCTGVDVNRNWDVEFGGPGSSSDECKETYHGPRAESENVTHHLANFLRSKRRKIKGLISLHSYGQQILYPYNYNKTKEAPTEAELKSVGNNMSAAMKGIHGKVYESGRGSQVLYLFSGSTSDWAYEKAGIPLSYTIELRDTGYFRFRLPASQIIATGEELMAGIKVIVEHIIENYLPNQDLSSGRPKA